MHRIPWQSAPYPVVNETESRLPCDLIPCDRIPNRALIHKLSHKTKQASLGQPVGASILMARCFYNPFLPALFAAAQRFRIPSAKRLRAAADMVRFFGALDFAEVVDGLLPLPGGRPRRLPGAEPPSPTPSSA
jgi:hypothetical protein